MLEESGGEELLEEQILFNDVVQLRLYLDFSEESEKALRIAWELAEELLEKNILVEVEPIHEWLDTAAGLGIQDYPRIVINGKVMFIGRAPSKQELLEAIMDRLGKRVKVEHVEETPAALSDRDGFCEAVEAS